MRGAYQYTCDSVEQRVELNIEPVFDRDFLHLTDRHDVRVALTHTMQNPEHVIEESGVRLYRQLSGRETPIRIHLTLPPAAVDDLIAFLQAEAPS